MVTMQEQRRFHLPMSVPRPIWCVANERIRQMEPAYQGKRCREKRRFKWGSICQWAYQGQCDVLPMSVSRQTMQGKTKVPMRFQWASHLPWYAHWNLIGTFVFSCIVCLDTLQWGSNEVTMQENEDSNEVPVRSRCRKNEGSNEVRTSVSRHMWSSYGVSWHRKWLLNSSYHNHENWPCSVPVGFSRKASNLLKFYSTDMNSFNL